MRIGPDALIAWHRTIAPQEARSPGERALNQATSMGLAAIHIAASQGTGAKLSTANGDFRRIIRDPERGYWTRIEVYEAPSIGVTALRTLYEESYRALFNNAYIELAFGVPEALVDEYRGALHVVPEGAPTDRFWVPERYLPSPDTLS